MASGEEASFTPYIYISNDNTTAHYLTNVENDLNDGLIGINANIFYPAYERSLEGVWKKLTGDNPDDYMLSVLRHELIHAKDPGVNNHYIKAKYNLSDPATYYGGWIEFPAQTGEFFEAIKNRSWEYLREADDSEKLKERIQKLFQFFYI